MIPPVLPLTCGHVCAKIFENLLHSNCGGTCWTRHKQGQIITQKDGWEFEKPPEYIPFNWTAALVRTWFVSCIIVNDFVFFDLPSWKDEWAHWKWLTKKSVRKSLSHCNLRWNRVVTLHKSDRLNSTHEHRASLWLSMNTLLRLAAESPIEWRRESSSINTLA